MLSAALIPAFLQTLPILNSRIAFNFFPHQRHVERDSGQGARMLSYTFPRIGNFSDAQAKTFKGAWERMKVAISREGEACRSRQADWWCWWGDNGLSHENGLTFRSPQLFWSTGPFPHIPTRHQSGRSGEGAGTCQIQFHSSNSPASLTQLHHGGRALAKQQHKPGLKLFWELEAEAGLRSRVSSYSSHTGPLLPEGLRRAGQGPLHSLYSPEQERDPCHCPLIFGSDKPLKLPAARFFLLLLFF